MEEDILSLRQERAKAFADLSAIQDKAKTEARAMTAEEQAQFDKLAASIEGLDSRIAAAEKVQKLKAAGAVPAPQQPSQPAAPAPAAPAATVPAQPAAQEEKGIRFAQATRALIVGRGNVDAAQAWAAQAYGESHPVAMELGAAMQTNEAASGGVLVPEVFSREIIDLLYPRTVIRRACQDNGMVVPLVGGTDNIPTVENGTSAYYIGEGDDVTATEPEFGSIKFVEREMAALVPISNKLLRHSGASGHNVDMYVRNMLINGMAQTEDVNFLRGAGTGAGPKGLRYLAGTSFAANGTVNVTNIDADARKAELALMEADIPMIDVRWIMPPRAFTYLRDLRDSNGNLVYPGLSLPVPVWKSYKVEVTNNVPKNLGGGGTEAEVYLVDFAFCMIADSYSIRIDASDTASYKVGGAMVSAFSKNQTLIRALAGHDFGVTRKKAVVVITGVAWGA
ncbi:phage major capsid protein [Magnetospirillum aberrantis]|uniref:Phage major capsid protein n=1 Tax=Magnetospirillum aberrantis SpK TaxID=908842 RepID=A0A7C9QT94_9PROT|nr:phage major capsid protein [Magnetospirillum aberrantis]NFV80005.1 phage major capsid protein [Magnetospirillum aberrantis SpK]